MHVHGDVFQHHVMLRLGRSQALIPSQSQAALITLIILSVLLPLFPGPVRSLQIGETICNKDTPLALPTIKVEEPTVSMTFKVNTSPFAGKEGKFVTSRNIKDRLDRWGHGAGQQFGEVCGSAHTQCPYNLCTGA